MIFNVTILGSGSAVPKLHRNPTSQYINVLERHILIDCAEGTQLQMQKFKVKPHRLQHILISHLHGDHYLGLVGLLSSMHLSGRTKPINLFGPEPLKDIIFEQLKHSKSTLAYNINFYPLVKNESELIFEDKCIEIHTVPLKHRIYTNGFLIKEKSKPRRINKAECDKLQVPVAYMQKLTQGVDYETEDGNLIPNGQLTFEPIPIRSYAFCSDTKYHEPILEQISGVNTLYHESTFLHDKLNRANKTFHTTALQAGMMANKANAKHLLLGHFSARYDTTESFEEEASSEFSRKISAVQDGDKFEVV